MKIIILATLLSSSTLYASENADSYFAKGTTFYNEKDYKQAIHWLQITADQGHAEAQNSLGHMYVNGNGVLKD